MKVFVYGTLKEGYSNNRLLTGCNILGLGILRNHILYNCGFPIAIQSNHANALGEVWEIPEELLSSTVSNLDRLEGYREHNPSSSMYLRKQAEIALCRSLEDLEASEKVVCHYYMANPLYWGRDHRECQQVEESLYEWSSYRI